MESNGETGDRKKSQINVYQCIIIQDAPYNNFTYLVLRCMCVREKTKKIGGAKNDRRSEEKSGEGKYYEKNPVESSNRSLNASIQSIHLNHLSENARWACASSTYTFLYSVFPISFSTFNFVQVCSHKFFFLWSPSSSSSFHSLSWLLSLFVVQISMNATERARTHTFKIGFINQSRIFFPSSPVSSHLLC